MRLSLAIAALVACVLLSACASRFSLDVVSSPYAHQNTWETGQIYHSPTGREMSEEELYTFLGGFRVVYVGESHDSVNDHAAQLKILKALNERFPGEVALGLEMLGTDAQREADMWVSGSLGEKAMMRTWSRSWGLSSYPYYRDILDYVRKQRISLVALNRPQQNEPPRSADTTDPEGTAASRFEPLHEPAIDRDDPYYDAYIGAFLAGHKAGPDVHEVFLHSQMLWDETMAETGAAFLAKPGNATKKLVVFAGNNHVRYGFGIPRRLFRRLPVNYTIVSPMVVDYPQNKAGRLMDVKTPALPLPAADILWLVGYEDLEEQRVMLGVSLAPADGGGLQVSDVYPGSPAARAGLVTGDIIRGIDGVDVQEMFDLGYELGRKTPGATGLLQLERNGEPLEKQVKYEHFVHP